MDKNTQKNLLNLVKNNYEDIAAEFDITRQKKLWPELLELAAVVKDGDRILDVGCGNGRLVNAFNDKQIQYLGVDISTKLIDIARKNYELKITNYDFIVGDILNLGELAAMNFDYIFSVAVLHHIPGNDLRVQALKQLKNKMSSEGKIIITVWNLWTQKKYRNLIIKHALLKILRKNKIDWGDIIFEWKNPDGQGHSQRYYHAFTKYGLKRIIKKAGLKIEKIYHDKYNYYLILSK